MAGMALAWLEVAGRGSVVQAAILDVDEPLLPSCVCVTRKCGTRP